MTVSIIIDYTKVKEIDSKDMIKYLTKELILTTIFIAIPKVVFATNIIKEIKDPVIYFTIKGIIEGSKTVKDLPKSFLNLMNRLELNINDVIRIYFKYFK